MNFQPLRDIVLIEKDEKISKSSGGIVLAGTAAETPPQGKVLAVGPGKMLDDGTIIEPTVVIGDTVLFATNSGWIVKLDEMENNDNLIVMGETEIIGIIR